MEESADGTAALEKALPRLAVLVVLMLVVRNAWVTEDAYITLRTVDHWVSGHGLRWNVDERVQGYTHPLWMLLLSALYALTRESFFTTAALGVAVTGGALYALVRFARSEQQALAAVAALALSRSFVDFSTSGLENPLSHLLLVVFAGVYVQRGALLWLSALAALIVLNRADTALVVAPALVHATLSAARSTGPRRVLRDLSLGFTPFFAWEAFSFFYYGALVPNTAYAKLNTGIPSAELWRQGLAYVAGTLAWDPALMATLMLCMGAAVWLGDTRVRWLALGAMAYVLYTVRVGGDFMLGRFLTVPLWVGAIVLTRVQLGRVRLPAVATLLAPLALVWLNPQAEEPWPITDWSRTGFTDERAYYREHASVMMATRSTQMPTSPWADDGRALARRAGAKSLVVVEPNIGFRGFYAGPRVHIIDPLALTDPLLARLPALRDPHWRVGHYMRGVPEGYERTLRDGGCAMSDRALCEYWQKVRLVTAGELWSWQRLRTAVALQLGHYDHLIDVERYRRGEPERERLERVALPLDEARLDWGLRAVAERGLAIELGRTTHTQSLMLAVSRGDAFELLFERGAETVGRLDIELADEVTARALSVPRHVSRAGFDRLQLRPRGGDGWYGVGALSLGPEPSWASVAPPPEPRP